METGDYTDRGLRGLTVATTRVSKIDGEKGMLIYRGYSVEELARNSSFEEVCHLLIHESLPNRRQLHWFSRWMAEQRKLPPEMIEYIRLLPENTPPMSFLQSAVALLASFDPELEDDSPEAIRRKGVRMIGKMPTLLASWHRIRSAQEPLQPDPSLPHAHDFLRMLRGFRPDDQTARALDIALLLHAEHSFNASTFTARVIASTRAHLYAAVSGAIGSLSGDLHGGANTRVMNNILEIGHEGNVDEWVKDQFDRGNRIAGMGHAVYNTMDPRAVILDEMIRETIKDRKDYRWYAITKRMEEVTQREFKRRKGKDIYANVDMYSAPFYYALGLPIDLFTSIFAVSRTAGWVAHILEEKYPDPPVKPMLYRPSATYVGDYYGQAERSYLAMEKREDDLGHR